MTQHKGVITDKSEEKRWIMNDFKPGAEEPNAQGAHLAPNIYSQVMKIFVLRNQFFGHIL